MFCMCWDDQERMESMEEHKGQCGTKDAAQLAQDAGVKKLALVHIGPNLSTSGAFEKGVGDAKRIYDGDLIFTDELMFIDI